MTTALPLPPPAEWMREAACVGLAYGDVDPWHPERGDQEGLTAIAKRICSDCPVKAECFAYGMSQNDSQGIWGGSSVTAARKKARGWK